MKEIQDTGVRGYLKWLQADQPQLYIAVAPIIAQRIPEAFSDHEQSLAQGALMGLAQDGADPGLTEFTPDLPAYMISGASTGSTVDVANAANTGAASSGVVGLIQGIVNDVAQAKLNQAQLDAYKQLNATQAQRISAGLNPLLISSSSLGIPFISGVAGQQPVTGGTALLMVGGILGLLIFLGRRGRA